MANIEEENTILEIQRILVYVMEDNKRLKDEMQAIKTESSSLSSQLNSAIEEIKTLKKYRNTSSISTRNNPKANGDSDNDLLLINLEDDLPSSSQLNLECSPEKLEISKGKFEEIVHSINGDVILELDERLQTLTDKLKTQATHFESRFKMADQKAEQMELKLSKQVAQHASSFASMHNVQNTGIQNQQKHFETKLDSKIDAKIDAKLETKLDVKLGAMLDAKMEAKMNTKMEAKLDSKLAQIKIDAKMDAKIDAKMDAKMDVKIDSLIDSKIKAKMDAAMDEKIESKMNAKLNAKTAANIDSKMAAKIDASVKNKIADVEKRIHEMIKSQEARLASKCWHESRGLADNLEKLSVEMKEADIKLKASKRDAAQLTKENKAINYKIKNMDENVEKISTNLKSQLKASITEEVSMLRGSNSGTLVWMIDNFSQKKADNFGSSKTIFSLPFVASEYGYRMIAHVDFNRDRLGVFLEFLPAEFGATLPPVFLHRRTFQILDQSPRADKRHIVRQQEPNFCSDVPLAWMTGNWGNPSFVSYALLDEQRDVYLVNDVLFVKVIVEPLTVTWTKTLVNDGVLLWRIDHYRRTKAESLLKINEFYESPSFYTLGPRGYRMQVRLHFTDTSMNVYPDFLIGQHDDCLEEAFSHTIRFEIVSQNDETGNGFNLVKRVSLNVATIGQDLAKRKMSKDGCDGVAFPFDVLECPPFFLDDRFGGSIVLKITVDAID